MFTISKEYHFSASHILRGLAEDHPCTRLHGHNYIVEIELQSESLNEHGFVRDYRELDALKAYIDDNIDHRHLNDIFEKNGENENKTTAEALARSFYHWCKNQWPETSAIRVRETPKTCAEYRP
jgi:6-pyruvoyltetrahydropterin/6-carboxytetrahydropterin synthase